MNVELKKDTLNAVLMYLSARPYAEVVKLFNEIQKDLSEASAKRQQENSKKLDLKQVKGAK